MSDLKIKLFSILNSIGPSMSAQQSEDISEAFNELDRLRAEVASLTKLHGQLTVEAMRSQTEVINLTQQLAAANGRVERMGAFLLGVQVQEGWKLVPVEPTADMIIAASDGYETGEVNGPASCYRVMIAAAPALPQKVKSE